MLGFSKPRKRPGRLLRGNISLNSDKSPETLKFESITAHETRFHIIISLEAHLHRVLIDTGATRTYLDKDSLDTINLYDYEIRKPDLCEITVKILKPAEIFSKMFREDNITSDVPQK